MKYLALGSLLLGFLWLVGLFSSGAGCATPFPPEGGDRDSIPPQLILEESTPNAQVNFRPREIVLTFDEWVVLKDPTQIIISPPVDLGEGPELKKKSLIIPLDEVVWEDSVTYTINLGESIVDFTEGNPVENLRFVFSTGPELDSAEVRGQVVDAYTGEGREKILVSLYANLADTAITTQRPFYFGFTDEDGFYEFGNLKPGTYRLYALENASGIYEFGSSTSAFAFLDSNVVLADTINVLPNLRMSPLPQLVQVDADTSRQGVISLGLDRPVVEVPVRTQRGDYLRIAKADTLKLFYQEAGADSIFIGDENMGVDTVVISATDWTDLKAPEELVLVAQPGQAIFQGQAVEMSFNQPLASFDSTLIGVYPDTLEISQSYRLGIDTNRQHILSLRSRWALGSRYRVLLQPGALTNYLGETNQDSITFNLQGADPASVGLLRLRIVDLDTTQTYLAKLINDANDALADEFTIARDSVYETTFERLPAATYRVELITDTNRNGRYDGTDWLLRRQPEEVRIFTLEALRANWELDAEISLETE
ncbi:MAG: Ig-like domain-containing protein [Bacteroidota bacterium]